VKDQQQHFVRRLESSKDAVRTLCVNCEVCALQQAYLMYWHITRRNQSALSYVLNVVPALWHCCTGWQGLEPEATHNESSPTYVENSVGLFDDGML